MKDSTKRTIRTVVQTIIAIAAGLPLIVDAAGIPEAAPGIAIALGVAAAVTRVMALPVVNQLLPGWLALEDPRPEV